MSRFARRAQRASQSPAIYLSPSRQTVARSETFTVSVRENSFTTGVNATQVNLTYPVALLDYVPTVAEVTTENPNGISFVGSAFSIAAEAAVDTVAGTVTITRGAADGTSLTGDQLIAKLTFTAKTTAGTANVTPTTGTALASVATNADILPPNGSGLRSATYTIT